MKLNVIILFVVLTVTYFGCQTKQSALHQVWSAEDSAKIISEILEYRQSASEFFQFGSESPFNKDTSVRFTGLHWYAPDIHFAFKSKLSRYTIPEQMIILGTKGEPRNFVKYGYFTIVKNEIEYKLNVYKEENSTTEQLSIWFTDETTGKETYNVGRYIDVGEESHTPGFEYTIDFNRAYNPYCAYNSIYTCAVPPKENRLPFAVYAGEMKYH